MYVVQDTKRRVKPAIFPTYQEAERFRWTLAYIYNNGVVERFRIVEQVKKLLNF